MVFENNGIFYCLGNVCPSHAYLCANNQCIPAANVCDGIVHCEDNSDETEICKGQFITSSNF